MENTTDGTALYDMVSVGIKYSFICWIDCPSLHCRPVIHSFFFFPLNYQEYYDTSDMCLNCEWLTICPLCIIFRVHQCCLWRRCQVNSLIFSHSPHCLLFSPFPVPPSFLEYSHQKASFHIHDSLCHFSGRGMFANTANQEAFPWCLRRRSMSSLWWSRPKLKERRTRDWDFIYMDIFSDFWRRLNLTVVERKRTQTIKCIQTKVYLVRFGSVSYFALCKFAFLNPGATLTIIKS